MKALVTGGAGFLGLYITEQLVARGDSVRVVSRRTHPRLGELGVEWQQCDIRDPKSVERACRDVDTVFHVAAVPGIWGPWKHYYETNTLGTRHVLEACRHHGISRLIYTSSPSVIYDGADHLNVDESYPYASRYLCHYPHSKALAEQEVLAANGLDGLATVALRPHLIWGPRDNQLVPRLIARARSGRLRRVGGGQNVISMSYVENAAAAHLQAADALRPDSPVAGKAYFINEPEPVNLWNWIDELLSLAGLPPVRKSISSGVADALGGLGETIYWTLRLSAEPPMTRFLAKQLSGSHSYQIARAQRDFGYKPLVSVAEGMRRLEPELRRLAHATT
ncbi:MAG TPA: NAD-dependent epimerase/dehydratase family protein [Planctomycetaceae bacterium]|jgi:nucleoside-diphosphate-sugar epimerase|nr:NAD-dependent epimerase/dehydratase family protein [Planctomycetaceae bacterium]